MKLVEGIFSKYRIGYARVLIEIETNCEETLIEIDLDQGDEWNEQFFKGNFKDWFEGAVYGATFGLAAAKIPKAIIKIKRIVGQIVDSNATTVAAATADAVWKAVNFEPSVSLIKHIEEKNRASGINHDLIKFD